MLAGPETAGGAWAAVSASSEYSVAEQGEQRQQGGLAKRACSLGDPREPLAWPGARGEISWALTSRKPRPHLMQAAEACLS
jgi:hypothetical protein